MYYSNISVLPLRVQLITIKELLRIIEKNNLIKFKKLDINSNRSLDLNKLTLKTNKKPANNSQDSKF
jgi:hypothetical protein